MGWKRLAEREYVQGYHSHSTLLHVWMQDHQVPGYIN